jgi:hypothetical protein
LGSQLKTQIQRIVSARQNLLLQKGAQTHGHSMHEEQTIGLLLDWSSSGAQSAHDWLTLHVEFGGVVGSDLGVKTELSE